MTWDTASKRKEHYKQDKGQGHRKGQGKKGQDNNQIISCALRAEVEGTSLHGVLQSAHKEEYTKQGRATMMYDSSRQVDTIKNHLQTQR